MAHFAAMLSGNKFLLGSTAVTFTVGIVGLIINELASGDFDDENEDSFLCGWNYVTWYDEGNENETYYWSYAGGSSFIACAIFAVLLTLISVTGHIPNIPEPVLSKIPFNVYNKKNELFAYCILISGILWLLGIIIFIIDGSCYEEGWNNENNEDEYEDGYTWELTLWLSLLVGITQVSTGGAKLWDNMKQNKQGGGGNNNESLINNDGNASDNNNNNNNNNNVNNENDNSGVTPQTGGGGGGGGDAVMAPTTQASAPQQDDGGYARMG